MADWTAYFHDRLSALEKQVFGPDQATAIAERAPVYDATTEPLLAAPTPASALTVPPGTAPTGPLVGEPAAAAPVDAVAQPADQSALIARLRSELEGAYGLLNEQANANPPPAPADVPAGPAGSMGAAPVNQPPPGS